MNSDQTQPRIYLAYDGSINADWVSRYAVRIASRLEPADLFLVHIEDGSRPANEVRLRIKAIEDECTFHNVCLHSQVLPARGDVFRALMRTIPAGPDTICICGARITSRGRGFLTNTISEKLLAAGKFNVLAIRVVQPGLLGWAEELLLPIGRDPDGAGSVMPVLGLLVPAINSLCILRVMEVGNLARRYMSVEKSRMLYQRGINSARQVADEINRQFVVSGRSDVRLDMRVVISANAVREILVHASELKTQCILIGASGRNFPVNYLQEARIEEILRNTPCDVAVYSTV